MSSPIGDQLAAEYVHHGIAHDIDHIRHIWQRIRHTETSPVGQPAKGTTMSTIHDDLEAVLEHVTAFAQTHLPELAAIQASPITRAIEGYVFTPEAEGFIADLVSTLVAKYGKPANAAPAEAAPAEPEPDPAPAQ